MREKERKRETKEIQTKGERESKREGEREWIKD